MSVRKKATPKKGRAKAKATPARRKQARKPVAKKPAAKPKRSPKKPARGVAKRPVAKKPAAKVSLARKAAEREKLRKEAEREKLARLKDKEREKKEQEREKLRKEAEREKLARLKDKEREKKEREREKLRKDAEREKALKAKAVEREKKEREKERARELKAKEAERAAALKAKEAERVAAQKAKDAEKERVAREREDERLQKIAERDAQREEAKRLKDEEKKAKDAEREAYRKAKETERERIRAEREAARRALEGKVARASKRSQRGDGIGRGVTTRQYRADTIPNQSGTTRRQELEERQKLLGTRLPEIAQDPPRPASAALPLPAPIVPPPPPPPQLSVEERWATINERLNGLDDLFQREYRESFEMSWVYHDSALEGVVYTFQELKTAIDPNMSVVADSGLQPVCDEIRRHRQAIEYVRELSEKKRVPITVDTIKKIYCILHPEEGDVKTVKYRKDIPQHRLYFHEYAAPDKIAYKARQVIDWLNGPEPKKLKSPVRIAARVHYDLLRVFPFPQDSGKVSRLLMNVLLMRAGHPPAIIHSTERQRYYEALKGQLPVIVSMVNESIMNALLSIEKKIEDHDATKSRSSSPPKGDEKPDKPTSAVAAVATARDDDSDLYLDQEMDDSDSDSDSDSDDDSGDD